jgi:hypothetical protein
MSKARPPASQPMPPEAGRQPGALQPFHVADRPQRGHHHVGLDGGPVREPSTLHVSARVALQRRHAHPAAQVHAVVALHLRGDLPDHPPERADQRRRAPLGDGHRDIEFPADRRHLRADEPGTDDQDPRRPRGQRLLQPRGVITRAQRVHALQGGLGRVGPLPRPGARGDQQPVVRDLLAARQAHLPGGPVQPGGGHPEPPLRIQCPQAGQLGVVGRHPTLEHLLGQRGTVVRLMRLVPDDGQRPGEALLAQGFGGPQSRQ